MRWGLRETEDNSIRAEEITVDATEPDSSDELGIEHIMADIKLEMAEEQQERIEKGKQNGRIERRPRQAKRGVKTVHKLNILPI